MDSMLWIPNSSYWITNSLSVDLGFRVPIVSYSLSWFKDSKAQDSGFHEQGFRNLDYLTRGDKIKKNKYWKRSGQEVAFRYNGLGSLFVTLWRLPLISLLSRKHFSNMTSIKSVPFSMYFELGCNYLRLKGQTFLKRAFLAVDDIAFQTGRCEAIPWQGKSLEGANPFDLHDGQMKGRHVSFWHKSQLTLVFSHWLTTDERDDINFCELWMKIFTLIWTTIP